MNVYIYRDYDCEEPHVGKYVAKIASESELPSYVMKQMYSDASKFKVTFDKEAPNRVDIYKFTQGQMVEVETPFGQITRKKLDSWDWIECHSLNTFKLCQRGDCKNIPSFNCRCRKRLCSSHVAEHIYCHDMW